MNPISCNFTTPNELQPYLSLPQDKLHEFVGQCLDVCLLIYGSGNPDLAGVGVRQRPTMIPPGETNSYWSFYRLWSLILWESSLQSFLGLSSSLTVVFSWSTDQAIHLFPPLFGFKHISLHRQSCPCSDMACLSWQIFGYIVAEWESHPQG